MTLRLDRPEGFERWNRALRGAFQRGMRDAIAGKNLCPYVDWRKSGPTRAHGRITWSRAFRSAWNDGYRWQKDQTDEPR